MASREKTFYFLKLEKDFFDKKEIKLLRKIAGGDTYTIIYLKMLLMSLSDSGFFYFENIGNDIAEEVAISIEEDIENVSVTLSYLQKKGLLEIVETDKYYLNSMPEMVGQVTSNALRQRRFQAKKKQQALENNATITQHNVEIELEKEQEIDIEKETESEVDIVKPATELNIYDYYQQRVGSLDGYQYEKLKDYLDIDRLEPALVKRAIDRAADNAKRNFGYVNAILKNWAKNDIRTIAKQDEEQRNFVDRKSNSFQNGNTSQPRKTNIPDWALEEIEQDNSEEAMQRMQALKARMLANEKNEPVPEWAEKVLASQQTAEGQAKLADIYAELEAMENGET
ncbi:TPA: phage replisome organizer N-terminal domain-containing protein [Streptococcus suis]|nr:phage replisome organizer N-terminal domain-containing protein [Streptococcus suis]